MKKYRVLKLWFSKMKYLAAVVCVIAISQMMFFRWKHSSVKTQKSWSIGGVSIGMLRGEVLRLKGPPVENSYYPSFILTYPLQSKVFFVKFDDSERVCYVWGFSLERADCSFSPGDSVQEVRKALGEPDSRSASTSIYNRSDLVISIDHDVDGIIRSFILEKTISDPHCEDAVPLDLRS